MPFDPLLHTLPDLLFTAFRCDLLECVLPFLVRAYRLRLFVVRCLFTYVIYDLRTRCIRTYVPVVPNSLRCLHAVRGAALPEFVPLFACDYYRCRAVCCRVTFYT